VTIEAQIEALEGLGSLDAELVILIEDLTREKEGLEQKRIRLDEITRRLESSRASLAEMDRTRADLVAEIRQMNVQIERSRDKHSRCRTEKETLAVQRELEELRKLLRDREVEVEKLGQLTDQARLDIGRLEAEQAQLGEQIGSTEAPVLERCHELEVVIGQKEQQRKSFVAKIRPQTYRRYELIRKRRGSALAHTTDGTCSACHISIPPMQFQQLMRRSDFDICPNCNRLLYFKVAVVAQLEDTSGAS
jgi:predicted  nucleic acid-binding Zn-ribbon protein